MSSRPSISVVIPLYNKGPHVERAITSVLDQDFPPAEIIVVDDASTDGGLEVVRQFEDVKVLMRSERGPGGYAARNLGVEAASGDWIAFLDADDRWRSNHLSSLAKAIAEAPPSVGCVFTRPVFVASGGSTPYPISETIGSRQAPLGLNDVLTAWLDAKTCPLWTGAVAIRRSVLFDAGLFPAGSATRGGDKDLWLRVMALTQAIHVPEVTAEFHQNTVNRVTHSLDHSALPIVCTSIERLLPTVPPSTRRLLRRLNNMEVTFYARYAAGAGASFNRDSFDALHAPALPSALTLMSYRVAGRMLRLLRPLLKPRSRPEMGTGPDARVARSSTLPAPAMNSPALEQPALPGATPRPVISLHSERPRQQEGVSFERLSA